MFSRGSLRASLARIEWPTILLAGLLYAAFGLVTWFHQALPLWLLIPAGAYLIALHGSLQHEAVHGHPTPWRWLNHLIVLPSLWLWIPFGLYRDYHLTHHRDSQLTDPLADPESYYVTRERWAELSGVRRALLWANNTFLGRFLIGPLLCLVEFARSEARFLLAGDRTHWRAWAVHLVGMAAVLAWVVGVCGWSLGGYLLLLVYPGIGLSLLRSFLEHQARPEVGERTVLIEAGPVMGLLFLNNNLHALHHAEPWLPWYRLPGRYAERREALLAGNGHYRFRGYWEVVARYLLWPKEAPYHPGFATTVDTAPRLADLLPGGEALAPDHNPGAQQLSRGIAGARPDAAVPASKSSL